MLFQSFLQFTIGKTLFERVYSCLYLIYLTIDTVIQHAIYAPAISVDDLIFIPMFVAF